MTGVLGDVENERATIPVGKRAEVLRVVPVKA